MTHPHPTASIPVPRILFVCNADTHGAVSALDVCHRLCDALAAHGMQPMVLQQWPITPQVDPRPAARTQEYPYPVYCSRDVGSDATLLCLVEQPGLVITLGADPIGLALPLLDAGLPCIAWFVNASSFQSLPRGTLDHRVGLAAATQALAAQLGVLTGAPVVPLLPPLSAQEPCSGGGDAVLVASVRREDGIHRVLQMALARPHVPFIAIAPVGQMDADPPLRNDVPPNVSVLHASRALHRPCSMAVLPALTADLPWDMLAHCLCAQLPILASSEPLLEHAVGAAGLVVGTHQPLAAWLDALDLMLQNASPSSVGDLVAQERAHGLRLPAALAAQQCAQLAAQYVRSGGQPVAKRL